MMIEKVLNQMIRYSNGHIRGIEHFLKVYTYASLIGKMESLDDHSQMLLELSAIVHDIACPLCLQKYNSIDGKLQEKESEPLVRDFFSDYHLPEEDLNRIVFLVTHHHTYTDVEGADYQILLEADYIVNAAEGKANPDAIRRFITDVAWTDSGKQLLRSVFCVS